MAVVAILSETQMFPAQYVNVHAYVMSHSHEAVLSLALLQCVFNEAAQFEEEQLLRWFGRGARAFCLTILFTQ